MTFSKNFPFKLRLDPGKDKRYSKLFKTSETENCWSSEEDFKSFLIREENVRKTKRNEKY